MHVPPKFITDASLAGLAKWLRLLGFNTVIYPGEAGREMMRQAQREGRVLLTRRRDMRERQFIGEIFLVPHVSTGRQLSFVINRYALNIHSKDLYSLCLICNQKLHAIRREDAFDRVPPFVLANCDHYNTCDRCGRIYWPGTHVTNALGFLREHHIAISLDSE